MEVNKLNNYEFSIVQALIFNPNLSPSSAIKQPSEEDFQDSKLVYFYPQDEKKEQKRNLVGLIEGNLRFYQAFQQNQKQECDLLDQQEQQTDSCLIQDDDLFIQHCDQLIEITGVFQSDFYLNLLLKFNTLKQPKDEFYNRQSTELDFLQIQNLEIQNVYLQIDDKQLKGFFRHFRDTFRLVYGGLENNEIETKKQEGPLLSSLFSTRFSHYLSAYGMFYSSKPSQVPYQSKLQLLKYEFRGINFAPIDQNMLLKINYLTNILQIQDPNITNHAVFFNGYYVNSNLNIKHVQQLYDYFYETHFSFQAGDSKVFKRFLAVADTPDLVHEQIYFTVLSRRVAIEEAKDESKEEIWVLDQQYFQKFYFEGEKEYDELYTVMIYSKKLAILLFYKDPSHIQKEKLEGLQKIVLQNQRQVTKQLEFQIFNNLNNSDDNDIYFYSNKMNFSIKASSLFYLKNIDSNLMSKIFQLHSKLQNQDKNKKLKELIDRSGNYWVVGQYGNKRTIVCIFSFQSIEELDKFTNVLIAGNIFRNIYI